MKKIFISILLVIFSVCTLFAAKVEGFAYLSQASKHDGIKALFKAISPTASTDSALTNDTGYYALNLNSGVYELVISKAGYPLVNEGQLLIISDTTLFHDSLEYTGLTVHLPSTIAGTLYADTHYIVMNKTWVKLGDTLFIEPGTVISMGEGAFFDVTGGLIANGTEEEKIQFKLLDGEPKSWYGMTIYSGPNSDFNISHCSFSRATRCIKLLSCRNFNIENCSFRDYVFSGIYIQYSAKYGHVGQCLFEKTNDVSIIGHCDSLCIFENNILRNMGNRGIRADSNYIVRNNKIYNCPVGISGWPKEVYNNDFYYNNTAINLWGFDSTIINNNTFYKNDLGIALGTSKLQEIKMNCFSQNDVVFKFTENNTDVVIDYNFFETTSSFEGPGSLGYGVPIDTNSKGDSVDTYGNIVGINPGFFTTDTSHAHAFSLNKESKCIDNGDPNYKDDDGSVRDIGAHPYIEWVGTEEIDSEKQSLNVYPNPFSDFTNIHFQNDDRLPHNFNLYDINGNLVRSIEGVQSNLIILEKGELKHGMYFFILRSASKSYSGKLVIE